MKPKALAALAAASSVSIALVGTVDASSPSCDDWNTPDYFMNATAADVSRCLDALPDPWANTSEEWTPFHFAARYSKSLQVLQILLNDVGDLKAQVLEAQDQDGWTPLHLAAAGDSAQVVQFLLDDGANPFARGKDAWTPMHMAAAYSDSPAVITALAKHDRALINAEAEENQTPLHLAAALSQKPYIIQGLVGYGADINATMKGGFSPLHVAVAVGKKAPIVDQLLQLGADIEVVDYYGFTPLHMAAAYDVDTLVVKELVEHDRKVVSLTTEEGLTALHVAAAYSTSPELFQLLITEGADVNAMDKFGSTPLHWAAVEKNSNAIGYLLGAGADPLKKSSEGKTPWDHWSAFLGPGGAYSASADGETVR